MSRNVSLFRDAHGSFYKRTKIDYLLDFKTLYHCYSTLYLYPTAGQTNLPECISEINHNIELHHDESCFFAYAKIKGADQLHFRTF